jgi:hypothetical protein
MGKHLKSLLDEIVLLRQRTTNGRRGLMGNDRHRAAYITDSCQNIFGKTATIAERYITQLVRNAGKGSEGFTGCFGFIANFENFHTVTAVIGGVFSLYEDWRTVSILLCGGAYPV